MGQFAAPISGIKKLPMSPEESTSAQPVFDVVNAATAGQSGRFLSYDGGELPW